MRILMLFTVGFSIACGLCGYLLWDMSGIWLELSLGFVFLSASFFLLKPKCCKKIGICAVGLAVGFLWYAGFDALRLEKARALDGFTGEITLTASDYNVPSQYGSRGDGQLCYEGSTYRVRYYTNSALDIKPGDCITGTFRLRYTGSGGNEKGTYLPGEGTLLIAYPKGELQVVEAAQDDLSYLPAKLRRSMLSTLKNAFADDVESFASALLLGEDSGLSYEQNTHLKASGIRHVIAVSGLHVSIVMAGIYLLAGRRRYLTFLLALPVLGLFAAMAGFTPSVVRACLMQIIVLLSVTARREYDLPTSLSFAVLVMLTVNPLAVTSVSFQLSVTSVIGIVALSGRVYRRIRSWKYFAEIKPKSPSGRLLNWSIGSVSVSFGAMVFTTPLCAVYFGTVSIVGIVTNMLTLWVISFIFYGVFLVCLLGVIWAPAAAAAAWLIAWPIRYVLLCARLLSAVPMGCVYMIQPLNVCWLIFAYAVIFVFLAFPGGRLYQAVSAVFLGLILVTACNWTESALDNYTVTVLDVGQGQCILLESHGKAYMVDCGGEYPQGTADLAAEILLSKGICRLDGLILTHYDSDHTGAAEYFLSRVYVDTLFLPADTQDPIYEMLAESNCGTVITVDRDTVLTWENSTLTVYASNGGDSKNEKSLCVLFRCDNYDILITGDRDTTAEAGLLLHTALPELDALVAGHHGAASSTGTSLLQATKPKTVLISVGADNSYGHPDPAVLQRLKEFGCIVRRTDLEGTIIIRG